MFKIVVDDYSFNLKLKIKNIVNRFNLKKFKIIITNYGFDDNILVQVFLKMD